MTIKSAVNGNEVVTVKRVLQHNAKHFLTSVSWLSLEKKQGVNEHSSCQAIKSVSVSMLGWKNQKVTRLIPAVEALKCSGVISFQVTIQKSFSFVLEKQIDLQAVTSHPIFHESLSLLRFIAIYWKLDWTFFGNACPGERASCCLLVFVSVSFSKETPKNNYFCARNCQLVWGEGWSCGKCVICSSFSM